MTEETTTPAPLSSRHAPKPPRRTRHERLNDALSDILAAGEELEALGAELALTPIQRTRVRKQVERVTAALADYEEALK